MTDSRSESAKAAPVQRKIAGSSIPISVSESAAFPIHRRAADCYSVKPDEPSDVVQRGHHHLQVIINKCWTGGRELSAEIPVSQHVCAVFPPTSNYLRLPSPPAQPTLIGQLRISSSSSPRTFFSLLYLHTHSISFTIPDAHESRYRRRATPPTRARARSWSAESHLATAPPSHKSLGSVLGPFHRNLWRASLGDLRCQTHAAAGRCCSQAACASAKHKHRHPPCALSPCVVWTILWRRGCDCAATHLGCRYKTCTPACPPHTAVAAAARVSECDLLCCHFAVSFGRLAATITTIATAAVAAATIILTILFTLLACSLLLLLTCPAWHAAGAALHPQHGCG